MKKDKSLNDEQNLAVYSRDHSILVSAPAGSGKTKILVNRILSLIEDDHINVNELLVLTFTKAAALEMKQRLTQQLNTKILTCDPALKSHLEKQKLLLNDAYITNFHSFCSDILSQYGYMINIDSQFQILENTDVIKQKILEQCLDQWVKDPAFMHFYRCHHTEYHFQNFKNIIFQLDNLSHTVYEFDQYIQKVKSSLYDHVINQHSYESTPFASYLKDILIEAYYDGCDAFSKLTQLCQDHGLNFYFESTKTQQSPYEALQHYYDQLKTAIDHDNIFCGETITMEKHRNASYKDVDEEIKKNYQELLEKAKTTFAKIYEKCVPSSIDELAEVLKISYQSLQQYLSYMKKFQQAYQNYKQQHSYLDFNDLEQYSLQLLEPQYGVSETLYHQLQEIMIDEYQDTNEIQENLILKIACFQQPEINRFMVGDMKQSIYRFRKADLDIFNEKYQTYGQSNDNIRIDLKFNYRSNKIVLDSINYIFNAIMDKRYGGLDYDQDPHAQLNYDFLRKEKCETPEQKKNAMQKLTAENRFDSEIMLVLKSEDPGLDVHEYEAKMIGKKIYDMVDHLDLDFGNTKRKATFKDIVILTRHAGDLITYKKTFDKLHIPNLIILTKGFFESPEIISCISFLKAINNCFDDIALISILKGPYHFSHFSESWLYQHKIKDMSMYESLLNNNDPESVLFLKYYHELVEYSRQHPVFELLEKFLHDSQYDTFVASLFNGKQRYENLRLMIEMLKNDQELSLQQIITKIDMTLKENTDYKPATISQDGDVVTFMTIHHSKGLEFPIVFVNSLEHRFNFSDSKAPLIQDKNFGIIMNAYKKTNLGSYKDVVIEFKNPLRGIFGTLLDNETINEEMRILYVALTRASQKLILTGHIKSIDMIEKWQEQIIQYGIDASHHLLPAPVRKSDNMLHWIMLAIIRHPQFIEQCIDHSLFDDSIINQYDLSKVKNNALKIKIYQEKNWQENTVHSKFHTSVMTCQTIDEYVYPRHEYLTSAKKTYQQNSSWNYIPENNLDRTIAVTSIIDDGDRYYPDLKFEDDFSVMKATDRGTIIHHILEKLPLTDNVNLDQTLLSIFDLEAYDQQTQDMILKYKNKIQDFLNSEVYQLMLNSQVCFKEKSFSFVAENQQIIHGIFDVICINNGVVTIIDYKTDRIAKDTDEAILIDLHKEQMNYYKEIMYKVFPDCQIQAIVFYLHINRYVMI